MIHRNLRTAHRPHRGAFSLVEVLIAILVLALGLLGLGAVFPVVIAQQRDAADVIQGQSAARAVEAKIRRSTETIAFETTHLQPSQSGYWSWYDIDGDFGRDDELVDGGVFMYEWVIPQISGDDTYQNWPAAPGPVYTDINELETGVWYPNQDQLPTVTEPDQINQYLLPRDRLIPEPFSGREPQFVWDLVARREPGADRPQIAIFVRRIDPRIRLNDDTTLSEALTVGVDGPDPILPVALNPQGNPAVDDGMGMFFYAYPQSLQVQTFTDHPQWLVFEDVDDDNNTSVSFATQPGQLLLDNTGTVRRVIGPVENSELRDTPLEDNPDARVVRVDPPFQPSHAPGSLEDDGYATNRNEPSTQSERASWLRQVVFTPRTPVTIRVVTLEEPSE